MTENSLTSATSWELFGRAMSYHMQAEARKHNSIPQLYEIYYYGNATKDYTITFESTSDKKNETVYSFTDVNYALLGVLSAVIFNTCANTSGNQHSNYLASAFYTTFAASAAIVIPTVAGIVPITVTTEFLVSLYLSFIGAGITISLENAELPLALIAGYSFTSLETRQSHMQTIRNNVEKNRMVKK